MSSSHVLYVEVFDAQALLAYVGKTLPGVTSVQPGDAGSSVTVTASPALSPTEETTLRSLAAAYRDPVLSYLPSPTVALAENTTFQPLTTAAPYVGAWSKVDDHSSLVLLALSDADSVPNGLRLEFGAAPTQVDLVRTYGVYADGLLMVTVPSTFPYVRLVYASASPQTVFALQLRASSLSDPRVAESGGGGSATAPSFETMHSASNTRTISHLSDAAVPILTVVGPSSALAPALRLRDLITCTGGESGTLSVFLVRDSTLSGAEFADVSIESSASLDVSASSLNDGRVLLTGCMAVGSSYVSELSSIELPRGSTLTVACRLNGAVSPAVVTCSLNWFEM